MEKNMNKTCREILNELAEGGKIKLWSDFTFPVKEPLQLRLKDMLEPEVEEKFYLSEKMTEKLSLAMEQAGKKDIDIIGHSGSGGQKGYIHTTNGIIGALSATDYKQPKQMLEPKASYIQFDRSGKGYNSQQDRAYDTEGLSPTLSRSNSNGDKSQIIEPICMNSKGGRGGVEGVQPRVVGITGSTQKNAYIGNGDECPTLTTAMGMGGGHVPMMEYSDYRIRKLTPTECWRLMGFTDEDINKCKEVGISNSQLYKQAGNSIVVNVLGKLLTNLLEV